MTVEISDEAYSILQGKVDRGEYASVDAALDESIRQSAMQAHDEEWDEEDRAYLNERIDAGLADVAAGRVISMEDFLAQNETFRLHKA